MEFWIFKNAGDWKKRKTVTVPSFPFYLKEMEFRYNHRNQDLFELLAQNITKLVPNLL
jgi:transposase